jgi:hypothetical protein
VQEFWSYVRNPTGLGLEVGDVNEILGLPRQDTKALSAWVKSGHSYREALATVVEAWEGRS